LTLWSRNPNYTGYELRRIATQLRDDLKQDADTSELTITGGQKRQVKIYLDPSKLRAYKTTPLQILQVLGNANIRLASGTFPAGNEEYVVETGGFLNNVQDIGKVVVAVAEGKPVYLSNLADITDGPAEISDYVLMNFGPGSPEKQAGAYEAVTIAIAKKKGTNATDLSNRLLQKVQALKGNIIPLDVEITTTRNYGDTAKDKSDELLKHMFIAAVSVTVLIVAGGYYRGARNAGPDHFYHLYLRLYAQSRHVICADILNRYPCG
jgi:outer membrane autotransporter protein